MSDKYRVNTNPLSWLSSQTGSVTIGEPYVADTTGWRTVETDKRWRFNSTKKFELGVTMVGTNPKITVAAAVGKSPIRFLPFRESGVAYMKLDDSASVVFTSQLTGCNMYVATVGGDVWVFHANANDVTDSAGNTRLKRSRAQDALQQAGGNTFDLSLERGFASYYQAGTAAGIFFGQKVTKVQNGKSAWGFYLYNPYDHQVHRLASSVAGTNATM